MSLRSMPLPITILVVHVKRPSLSSDFEYVAWKDADCALFQPFAEYISLGDTVTILDVLHRPTDYDVTTRVQLWRQQLGVK